MLIDDLTRAQADVGYFYAQSYNAKKQVTRLKESLASVGDISEYGSQYVVLQAQVDDAESQRKRADKRYHQGTELVQRHLTKILSHDDVKSFLAQSHSQPTAVTAQQPAQPQVSTSDLEQRLAALEQSHQARATAQDQKNAILDAQLKATSAGVAARDKRIEKLERDVAQLTGKLDGANDQIRQLQNESYTQNIASHTPQSIAGTPEITDLQTSVKALELRLKHHEVESRRFDEQYKEMTKWKTRIPSSPRNAATKDDLQASAAESERKMTELVQNFKELQRMVNDVSTSVEDRRIAAAAEDLAPRILNLEKTTCKKEDIDKMQPDALKAILRRDLASDIAQEVSQQMAAVPPRGFVSSMSPAPAQVPTTLEVEAVAVEVSKRIQEKLNLVRDRFAELLIKERAERQTLSTILSSAKAELTEMAMRITTLETSSSSVSPDDLQKVRTEYETVARAIGDAFDAHKRERKEELDASNSRVGRLSTWITDINGRVHKDMVQINQQFAQLTHQHNNLLTWQQNFSTRAIWVDALAQMQELDPKGAFAKMRNLEARVDKISRMVHANGPRTG